MRPMFLAVLAAVSLPADLLAQQPKPDTYLLQVAAAVAGYSAGGPVYVVICETGRSEYKVIGAFPTDAQAREVVNSKRESRTICYVEGPFYSAVGYASTDMQAMAYGGGCKKGPDSDCVADSTAAFIGSLGNIQEVMVTYRFRDGRPPVSERFDPRTVEAIFFTMPAVDRMLIPYFVRVYGVTGAVQRRRVLLAKFGGRDAY